MKLNKIYIVVCLCIISLSNVNAQFADFHNYPVTVTPHESADSTRGHFWGYMFGSYYTKLHANDSVGSGAAGVTQYANLPKGANAFSMQRVYLGYDYFFNKQFSVHAVMAHEENADDAYAVHATVDQYGNRIFYMKYANMEWDNIFKGSKLSVGIITTPSFAITEEPFWGYRSIDRTIMDMKGVTGSNDMGVNLGGKLWSKKDDMGVENACIGYNIMVGNGTGAVPDNFAILSSYTIWKKYYGDVYVKMMNDKLVLDLYGDGRTLQWSPFHAYILTERAFIGYKTKSFNISAEYFEQQEKNLIYLPSVGNIGPASTIPTGGDTIQDATQAGYSIMAAVVLMRDKSTTAPELSLYARYDSYNPQTNFDPKASYYPAIIGSLQISVFSPYTESYYVVGLDYQPIKQIHLMPNIMYDGITDRSENLRSTQKFDYDFIARITFYYQFFKN